VLIELKNMANKYGSKDGSQRGRKAGGRGRNRTSQCRHPNIRRK
jgi:hypothetical protein